MKNIVAKRGISLILAVFMVVGLLTVNVFASPAGGFTDIGDKYYAHIVEKLSAAGIMVGVGNGKFNPDGVVTRAMAVTVLGRMANVTAPESSGKFTDVDSSKGSWYAGYAEWAVENGIVPDVVENRFEPDRAVTASEMDAMLARYAKLSGIQYTASITSEKPLTRGELTVMLYCIYTTPAQSSPTLPVEPEWGANPAYSLWTVVETEEAGATFPVTVSANDDLTRFELLFSFYGDSQKMTGTRDGDTINIDYSRVGMIAFMGVGIIQHALEQDIWLPVSECPLEYVDPAAGDDQPPYVQAGVWDEDFERANENLNGLPYLLNDDKVVAYKTTPAAAQDKGTVEMLEYTTGGETAYAYVYLPASYDESKDYNVLYLLHGGGNNATSWFTNEDDEKDFYDGDDITGSLGYAVNILDNMFANGDAEPCIVVTPNGGDFYGFSSVLRDLIAKVDATYSTNADREHRAMMGLSMGSIATWYCGIVDNLENISWFGNMSAGPDSDVAKAEQYVKDSVIPALEAADKAGYKVNMMLNFNGTLDVALAPHVATHKLLVEFAESSDILEVGENYDFIVSNGSHEWAAWNLYLYDALRVFFK